MKLHPSLTYHKRLADKQELIADFMDVVTVTTQWDSYWYIVDGKTYTGESMKYDTSYDWIIPVYNKCCKILNDNWKEIQKHNYDLYEELLIVSDKLEESTRQEYLETKPIFIQVVNCIKWWNKNKDWKNKL